MFIAKNNDLIVLAKETIEELEQALQFMVYTSIEETLENYVLHNGQYLTQEELENKEKERIAKLYLTGADVERGIYKAKGMDFDDILAFVTANPPEGLDIKALRIELKANNFYRGNPYVDVIGRKLGFTKEQLDKFFEKKDYHYLTNCTLTVNAVPEESTVIINDVEQKQITVPYGSQISIQVSAEGYKTYSDVINELLEDETLDVVMSIEDITDNNDDK